MTAKVVPTWLLGEQARLSCRSALSSYLSFERIENVAVRFPCYSDEDYLRRTPGLYPDLLIPMMPGEWIEVPASGLSSLPQRGRGRAPFPVIRAGGMRLFACGRESIG